MTTKFETPVVGQEYVEKDGDDTVFIPFFSDNIETRYAPRGRSSEFITTPTDFLKRFKEVNGDRK